MRVTDKAIVLQSIRHGDRKQVVKLYSRDHGLLTTIAVPGKSASARIKASALLPMSLIDGQLIIKQNKEVHQLVEASVYRVHANIHTDIRRLGIAQFLNEILLKVLKEQTGNAHMFEFIESCIAYLDEGEQFINLHLYFLTELTRYLGFEPRNNPSPANEFFDMREGAFSPLSLVFPLGLNERESRIFSEYLKGYKPDMQVEAGLRPMLLEILLAYYKLHLPAFGEVKSLEVLKLIQH